MRKFLLSLVFAITAIAMQAQEPAVIMTTTTAIGSNFSFSIAATANGTPIQVDWGNGTLVNYTIGLNNSDIFGILSGSTVSIYGVGIKYLDVFLNKLTALDITKCSELTILNCGSNQLTTLDVTHNTGLTELACFYNQLTSLNLTQNTALVTLECFYNQLTSLNLTQNTALATLECYYNQLTSLNLTQNTALTVLECESNQLTTLDISKNIELTDLDCDSNQLTNLDASNNTALKSLDFSSNQLTAIDVSKNTALTFLSVSFNKLKTLDISKNKELAVLYCQYNQFNTLDLSQNIALKVLVCTFCNLVSLDVSNSTLLTELYCSSNKLTTLDVTKNTNLTILDCRQNSLTIGTLPIKQPTWITYNYESQSLMNLPKIEYAANEEIDLNNQLIAGSNTTIYKWKTVGGITLIEDVDYIENCGKFTFIKQPWDYFYCEMQNATFPDLTLLRTNNISVTLSEPVIAFKTSTPINSQLTISLGAYNSNNRKVKIDWGNGVLTDYTINFISSITGTLTGNTVKIYGLAIAFAEFFNQKLSSLTINNPMLAVLDCRSNNLSFNTLPIKQPNWTNYLYNPQAKLILNKTEYAVNEEINLSNQLTAGGYTTVYTWKTASGITLVKDVDYVENNGRFAFKKQPWEYFYCEMKNAAFPDLTITTGNVSVALSEPILSFTTLAPSASQQTFILKANSNNCNVKVDWGNGVLTDYSIGFSNTNITGTLSGNTVKVFGLGITYVDVSNKKLSTLTINNPTLTSLVCKSNNLTFNSLPVKQQNWTTYIYSPQAKFPLPKLEYAINEEIDLSSQLVAGGNTTAYVWKTMKGITLFKNVDYTENNGIFVFLKAYSDSVYCEMTNATFPELTLITKNIATYLSLPTISMVSASAIGSNFFFDISAKENTPITVDFGNGLLSNYTMGINSSRIEGKLSGDTVKIWGMDIQYISVSWMELTSLNVSNALNLKSLHCNFNQLTSLDISKNIQLDHLYCNNNQLESLDLSNNTNLQYVYNQNNYLTFATLPLINSSWFDFSYSPQFPIKMEKAEYSIGETLDLSSQLSVNGTVTTYAWVTSSGNTLTKDVDYVENNGKFTFLKGQTETIYCQMTNATFPSLALKTISITISPTPSVIMTTTKAIGSTFLFEVSAEVFNTPIIVDWGNGTLMNYTIGANSTSISGILAGNTIKIFGDRITSIIVTQNQLTSLDVTNATKLTRLYCYSNLLTSLDVTKNTKLQQFMCGSNQLTSLNVSQNTELKELSCSSNLLTSLDVSQNTKMTELICSSNLLTSLDVSKNIFLQILWCDANKLSGLDVTQNPELNNLLCHSNELTSLDLTHNTLLQEIWCTENQITNLDVSKNTVLKNLLCSYNQLASLDVSKNPELQKLLCSSNQITSLNVSNNYVLTTLTCESNLLTFSTLPIKQATWTSYYYDPQGKITLPKVEYEIKEEIDLSNQFSAGSNTTNYTWKTTGGITLIKGVDYTENNGKFTFLKQPGDYFYCEMRNATFPDLTLTTNNISVALSEPILSFTTLASSASQQNIILKANSNNSNVKVDWGNGILTDNTVGPNSTNITGTLAGNAVKVYGLGITYADLSNKKINAIEIKSSILAYVDCKSNNLTFSSLPLKQQDWTTYIYSPQNAIKLTKKQYGLTETVNLSSELTVDGKTTSYIWKTKGGATLTAGIDYSVTGGVTKFLKIQSDSIYCQMSNATFPDLTLTTTNIKVSQFPLSVTNNEVAVKVYPNPASDNFSVEMAEEIVKVEVYTITGVKVFENSLYSSTKVNVPLTNMPKGTLLVRTYTRNGVYESKVIKI